MQEQDACSEHSLPDTWELIILEHHQQKNTTKKPQQQKTNVHAHKNELHTQKYPQPKPK